MCLCHLCQIGTGESWGVNRHAARYTGPVFVASQCQLVLKAIETDISAAQWPHAAREGLLIYYLVSRDKVHDQVSASVRTVELKMFRAPIRNCTNLFRSEPNRTRHRIFVHVRLILINL